MGHPHGWLINIPMNHGLWVFTGKCSVTDATLRLMNLTFLSGNAGDAIMKRQKQRNLIKNVDIMKSATVLPAIKVLKTDNYKYQVNRF